MVHVHGRWFRVDDGAVIACDRFRLLGRLLVALSRSRIEAPGVPVTATALLEAGWPAEQIFPRAARNRLHVALHRLRRLGLEGTVRCVRGGWLVDREVTVELCEAPPAAIE